MISTPALTGVPDAVTSAWDEPSSSQAGQIGDSSGVRRGVSRAVLSQVINSIGCHRVLNSRLVLRALQSELETRSSEREGEAGICR
jgi:hypothetical protein